MDSLWALVQNNEYVMSMLFNDYGMFPEVYGSCGGYYAVEEVK